mmetsp:Transcript_54349/g.116047  ORF Transcript_54349/g.116047 Transcript_54349/m.116047 type:complete len:116 (+) Transcript_54349:496-843(+)
MGMGERDGTCGADKTGRLRRGGAHPAEGIAVVPTAPNGMPGDAIGIVKDETANDSEATSGGGGSQRLPRQLWTGMAGLAGEGSNSSTTLPETSTTCSMYSMRYLGTSRTTSCITG